MKWPGETNHTNQNESGLDVLQAQTFLEWFVQLFSRRHQKFWIVLLFAQLLLPGSLYLYLNAEIEVNQATEINISGRQRMLTHKILLQLSLLDSEAQGLYIQPIREELLFTIGEMHRNHFLLFHKTSIQESRSPLPKNVKNLVFQDNFSFNDRVIEFLKNAEAFISSDKIVIEGVAFDRKEWVSLMIRSDLLERLDEIVNAFVEASAASIREIHILETVLLILTAIFMFLFPVGFAYLQDRRKHLRKRDNLLSTLVEHIPEAVILTDHKGMVVYANPAFEQITGYQAEEILGQNPNIWKSGWHSAEFYQELWETIQSEKVWRGTFINRTKQGKLIHVETSITRVQGANEKEFYYIGLQRDLTIQVQLEQQVRNARNMEALGALTYGVAHDFNNLLSPIMGWAEYCKTGLPSNSEYYEPVTHILTAAQRSRDLVKDLMAVSKNKGEERIVVDLEALMREAVEFILPSLPKGIIVSVETKDQHRFVLIKSSHGFQAIVNLLLNASQAMSQGGKMVVQVVEKNGNAIKSVDGGSFSGKCYGVSIEDSGVGMNKETIKHIFDPYFSSKKGSGSGLGLFNVSQTAIENDGFLQVESEVGKGSVFRLFFEALPEELHPSSDLNLETFPLGEESILFVDDEQLIVDYTVYSLGRLGYKVFGYTNCVKALEHFQRDPQEFDLVIADYFMPEMVADIFVRKIRIMNMKVPLLIYSGGDIQWIKDQLNGAGHLQFLQKPAEMAVFSHVLRRIFDQKYSDQQKDNIDIQAG